MTTRDASHALLVPRLAVRLGPTWGPGEANKVNTALEQVEKFGDAVRALLEKRPPPRGRFRALQSTATAIPHGAPVYITAAPGSNLDELAMVGPADARLAASMPAVGLADGGASATQDAVFEVVRWGPLAGLDTSGWAVGTLLYVAPGGGLTSVATAQNTQSVAVVAESAATNGILWVTGGGSQPFGLRPNTDHRTVYEWWEFFNLLNGTPFLASLAGTGTITSVATTTNRVGEVSLNTFAPGDVSGFLTAPNIVDLGNSEIALEADLLAPTIPTALQDFTYRFGLGDFVGAVATGAQPNGVTLEFQGAAASPFWQTVTSNGGVATTTNTGVTFGNTRTRIRLVINAAGTSVGFWIDGVLVATHATNIPAGQLGFGAWADRTVGVLGRAVRMDYVSFSMRRGTPL